MSKKTEDFVKKGTIKFVISKLNGIQKHEKKLEKLIECKDLDKCYKDSLRYGRLYIHHDKEKERDEFFKESYWLGRKLDREEKNETVIETKKETIVDIDNTLDVDFINKIEELDKEKEKQIEVVEQQTTNENSLVKRLIEFGITKLNINVLNDCKVNYMIVGGIGDNKVCYLSDFDKIVELIENNSYVEQK